MIAIYNWNNICSRVLLELSWSSQEQFERALEGGTLVQCSRALGSTEEQSWVFMMLPALMLNLKTEGIRGARGLDDAWISADSGPGLLDMDWTERVLLHPGWFEQHIVSGIQCRAAPMPRYI